MINSADHVPAAAPSVSAKSVKAQDLKQVIEEGAAERVVENLAARLLMAQEEERRRISRELHDQIGQTMTLLGMELKRLRDSLPPGDPNREGLETCLRLAEDNAAIVRNMALLLRPSMLDDLGLVPALHWQAREVFRGTGMEVSVDAEEACNQLPDEYRTCIYRVVQEALHNASKHAHAAHAFVSVRQERKQIRMLMEDDGNGFDTRRQKGMGLLGMEERVRYLGGEVEVDSDPGCGTCISIVLPNPAVVEASQPDLATPQGDLASGAVRCHGIDQTPPHGVSHQAGSVVDVQFQH